MVGPFKNDVKADGDYLVISLEAPNGDFPVLLSDYHAPVYRGGSDGKIVDPGAGIGTGAFKVVSYDVSQAFLQGLAHIGMWA